MARRKPSPPTRSEAEATTTPLPPAKAAKRPWEEDTGRIHGESFALYDRKPRPCLTMLVGPSAGALYRVEDKGAVLGRHAECDVHIPSDSISRRHAWVMPKAHGLAISDLRSTNGTYLNGDRITEAMATEGDKIQLGDTIILRYSAQDELDQTFQQQMYDMAVRDVLTGINNRKAFLELLRAEVAWATRHKLPLSVLMVDVDHFRKVNDAHGYMAGDRVLQAVARGLSTTLRAEDVLARFGGEEFAVACRGTPPQAATAAAERLRMAVDGLEVLVPGMGTLHVTVSVGVTTMMGHTTPEELMERAGHALERAKAGGRNRVELLLPPPAA
jgi:two-component system cell cycle response regulator